MNDETKKEYEISFLLATPEGEKELNGILAKLGAEVFFQKPASSIQLAYKIQRHSSAMFGYYHFRATPAVIKEMKDALNLATGVLRFLILTPPVKMPVATTEQVERGATRVEKKPVAESRMLSNEALSEKLEEILK